MNDLIVHRILTVCIEIGIKDIVICPGGRNAPFVMHLNHSQQLRTYTHFEERSAAFFALGRAQRDQAPVAVITTSGTAAGELLPAAMEGYYTGTPLLLITADRPRRLRGTGAPQVAHQVDLYRSYVQWSQDLEGGEEFNLNGWSQTAPAHLNVCFEEPSSEPVLFKDGPHTAQISKSKVNVSEQKKQIEAFLDAVECPLLIVSSLPPGAKDVVLNFLLKLQAPVYLEGTSGLRENRCLEPCVVRHPKNIPYIDSVIRIGGIPTLRFWRDLEEMRGELKVLSISHLPFSGLSWGQWVHGPLEQMLELDCHRFSTIGELKERDQWIQTELLALLEQYPQSEPALISKLSDQIPSKAHIYLGNSMPIREWDLVANTTIQRHVTASRGLNGIDGQISTFLGQCRREVENWGLFGDLTTLYDLAGFWPLTQLSEFSIRFVVINNGGGKIFSRKFPHKTFQNGHHLNFKDIASFWNLSYQNHSHTVIHDFMELVPDSLQTTSFWQQYHRLLAEKNIIV